MIKIVIINDAEQEQNHIHALLSNQRDFEISEFGKDSYDALKLVEKYRPHVIIIDLRRDIIGGPDLVALIKRRYPSTAIILLSDRDDEESAGKALSAGALGYLIKKNDMDKLADSIRIVHGGGCFISAALVTRTFGMLAGTAKYRNVGPNFSSPASIRGTMPPNLNRIELLIMAGIGCGHSNKEIAERLRLSPGTIRNYLSLIMRKVGLKNRSQVAVFASRNGLIDMEEFERLSNPGRPGIQNPLS
jgi:DNA-binding NarL/FixJ family response regulator